MYGADDVRVVQDSRSERTLYVGLGNTGRGFYERTKKGETTEHTFSMFAGNAHGGSAFALRVVTEASEESPTTAMKYLHTDHLGSVTAISDDSGHVIDVASGAVQCRRSRVRPVGCAEKPGGQRC